MSYSLRMLFMLATALGPLTAADQPNILWITSEDNGPHLGCYGDEYATTPNLDALAAKGMIYTNASSNAPVCAPARTTIITGVYPTSTGGQHMRSTAQLPSEIIMYPQLMRDAGYYCTNNSKTDYNVVPVGGESPWDESSKKAHWNQRPDDSPFFAIFNHTISHESQMRNKIKDSDRIHDPAKVRIPAYHPDTPEVRKNWAQYYDRLTMMDARAGANLSELEQANLSDNTIIFYYGDHGSGLPRNKRWPYRSGLNVPLIVYFPPKWQHLAPSDYQAGGSSDRLVSFVDLAPTLMSLTGREPLPWMQGHAFAGHHQTEEQAFSFGFRGRMDECFDQVRTVMNKRYIYLRHYMPHREYGQYLHFMFQTPTTQVWKKLFDEGKLNAEQSLFWQTKPREELYDFLADRDEVVNLATSDNPEHQAALTELRQAHHDWTLRTRDIGLLQEAEFHRRAQAAGVSPQEMAQDPAQYDLETIFQAAQLATSQNSSDLPAIVELLNHSDSAVRYWGATGLLIQGQTGYDAGHDALVAAISDTNNSVAIVACEAVGRYGSDEECAAAMDKLIVLGNGETQSAHDANFALNAISFIGARAKTHLDAIKGLPQEAKNGPQRTRKYAGRLIKTIVNGLTN